MKKILRFGILGACGCLLGALAGELLLRLVPASHAWVTPAWTAFLAIFLSFALVIGQNLYLHRRFLSVGQGLVVLVGGVLAGVLAGGAGQGLFVLLGQVGSQNILHRFLQHDSLSELARFLGWLILGGLLGGCISFFIPNLQAKRAVVAGSLGGLAAAWAFVDMTQSMGDLVGRLAGSAILGLFIGLMIALVETAFQEAWLEVVFGPKEVKKVGLGREAVSIGDRPECTVYAKGAKGIALRYRFTNGQVVCEDGTTGRSTNVENGDTRKVGNLTVRVSTLGHPAQTAGGGPVNVVQDYSLRLPEGPPIPLGDGKKVTAAELPGFDASPTTAVGEVLRNPQDPSKRGIKNLSRRTWSVTLVNGEKRQVDPERVIQLAHGTRINFGPIVGQVEKITTTHHRGGQSLFHPLAYLIFGALFFGLALADWNRRHPKKAEDSEDTLVVEEIAKGQETTVRPLRIAVTPPQYDDMGKLLDSLGKGYNNETITLDQLQNEEKLSKFDILFLTCATSDADLSLRLKDSLRRFVEKGGTLYASDLRFDVMAAAFPEFVDQAAIGVGKDQDVRAEVVDAGLRELLGAEMTLHFDLTSWRPAAFAGADVTVILKGSYQNPDGKYATAPLLVKFPVREGMVIFTSFHNAKQTSDAELKLLRHLVFTAVTAKIEAQYNRELKSGGFSPQKRSLLSYDPGNPSVTYTFRQEKVGRLRFALAFANQGARLKLTIVAPNGKKCEKEANSTLIIDVPDAQAGEWQYTVSALEVPYENFPFTVNVAERE